MHFFAAYNFNKNAFILNESLNCLKLKQLKSHLKEIQRIMVWMESLKWVLKSLHPILKALSYLAGLMMCHRVGLKLIGTTNWHNKMASLIGWSLRAVKRKNVKLKNLFKNTSSFIYAWAYWWTESKVDRGPRQLSNINLKMS